MGSCETDDPTPAACMFVWQAVEKYVVDWSVSQVLKQLPYVHSSPSPLAFPLRLHTYCSKQIIIGPHCIFNQFINHLCQSVQRLSVRPTLHFCWSLAYIFHQLSIAGVGTRGLFLVQTALTQVLHTGGEADFMQCEGVSNIYGVSTSGFHTSIIILLVFCALTIMSLMRLQNSRQCDGMGWVGTILYVGKDL